jgi:hypothetical protein
LARSWNDVTSAGSSGGVAISSVLDAKLTGSPSTKSSPTAASMMLVSAEAKTSADAPCWSWAIRSDEPAKLNVTFTPSWSASKSLPSSVKAEVNDDAAKTVRLVVPDVSLLPEESSELPQAARGDRSTTAATAPTAGFMALPVGSR